MSWDSDSCASESETLPSYRTLPPSPPGHGYNPHEFAATRAVFQEMSRLHYSSTDSERSITVNITDANDTTGDGMSFTLGFDFTLKHAFDAFKAASCKKCRSATAMRFKVGAKRISENDTPGSLKTKHREALIIRVYSNGPGLNCSDCRKTGYPTTKGAKLDGNHPITDPTKQDRKQLIRLLFEDPNLKITAIPVTSSYKLKHAMSDYAQRSECNLGTLSSFYEGEGIDESETAEELGMTNNSVVTVRMNCLSG